MRFTLWTLAFALIASVAACGSSPDPVNRNETGNLADSASEHEGRKCDSYTFSAGSDWNVQIAMTSEWDNYLYLTRGSTAVADDDDTDGTNARISTTVTESGEYTVHACAYDDGRGAYTLNIQANPGS